MTVEKVIASPDSAAWRHENLIGQVTVFVFFPNVYDSTEALSRRWNELVDRFADKVQFVMIARDDKSKLKPWLEKNPLKGWLLLDSHSEIARAFGMPHTAFVDRTGRILGFGQELLPFDSQIEDVVAGRVTRPRLRAKPIPPGGDKPDVLPSYTVHVAPTKREQEEGTSQSTGPDHWTALYFELKAVIAQVYGIDVSRIEFPAGFDAEARYDFAVLLPLEEEREIIYDLVRKTIERYFHVTIMREIRSKDVYILIAPTGLGPALTEARFSGGGFMGMSSLPIPWHSREGTAPTAADLRSARVSISSMSGSGMTIAFLCSAIENQLDRPVIDETGLLGDYDFQVQIAGNRHEEFFQALRDQLGLVVTVENRDVTMLVVRRA